MTQKECYNEVDMLKGNINRMCTTESVEELERMKQFAINRINAIYDYKIAQIKKSNGNRVD